MKSEITEKALKKAQKWKDEAIAKEDIVSKIEMYSSQELIPFTKEELLAIKTALLSQSLMLKAKAEEVETAISCGSEDGDLSSHNEKKIFEGCLSLLFEAGDEFLKYLDYIGADPEEEPNITIGFSRIVNRLFLWSTSHSGGTSTTAKCRQLGINPDSCVNICEKDREEE